MLVAVTVPGANVTVAVLVVEGVGIERQAQAVEMYWFDQSLGIAFGLPYIAAPRFPSGAGAAAPP